MKFQARLSCEVVIDFDLTPPKPIGHSETERFGEGLFGGEAEGKSRRVGYSSIANRSLTRCEYPLNKSIPPSSEYFLHSANVHQVYSNPVNHFKNA